MATDREKFDFEGSTWVRKGGEPTFNKKGEQTGHKPYYYESASNQYNKSDRLYIEPTADGKDIQLRQVQKEGEYYHDYKVYDKYFNWKGNVDFAGNLPHLNPQDSNSVKFHLDYTDKFAKERGYKFEKDASGATKTNTINVDGEGRSYVNTTDGGRVLLGYAAATQRDTYFKDLTANNKPIIYDRLGTRDDLTFKGICNARAPGTVMQGLGYKMSDAQVKENGNMGVMIARTSQEHGNTLIDGGHLFGRKPSNITIEALSEHSFSKYGFEIPQGGSIYNGVSKPEKISRGPLESDIAFEQKKRAYDDQLEVRAQRSLDRVRPWVIDQIKKGNAVVAGGDFTPDGHVVTIVGYDSKGYIVHDSWGDATRGYGGSSITSGQYVHYPFDKFSLGYGYILKKKK